MPTTRPETVIAGLIEAATALDLGTNLFTGPPKKWQAGGLIPRDCVFVYSFLSFMPTPYVDPSRQTLRDIRVCIFVRQNQDQFEAGQTLARSLWDACQLADVSAYANEGYITVKLAESDPQYIGMDDLDDHRWVMHARVLIKE